LIDLIPIDEEAPPVSQLAVPFKVLGMAVDVCKPLIDQKPQIYQKEDERRRSSPQTLTSSMQYMAPMGQFEGTQWYICECVDNFGDIL
jgi:hypothetical protein